MEFDAARKKPVSECSMREGVVTSHCWHRGRAAQQERLAAQVVPQASKIESSHWRGTSFNVSHSLQPLSATACARCGHLVSIEHVADVGNTTLLSVLKDVTCLLRNGRMWRRVQSGTRAWKLEHDRRAGLVQAVLQRAH